MTQPLKKNEILPFSAWIDLKGITLSKVSQTEKREYHVISFIHKSKKSKQKNKQNKTKTNSQIQRIH